MNRFNWTWDIGGDGPHLFLQLEFEESSGEAMHAKMLQLLPEEFELRDEEHSKWMNGERWDYVEISLEQSQFWIERGWGGKGEMADSRLLEHLLGDEKLSLSRWRVMAGGDGYPQIYIDSGVGTHEFLVYCGGKKEEESSTEEVENALRRLVEAPEMNGKYRLGKSTIEQGRLNFPVIYASPIAIAEWEARALELFCDFGSFASGLCDVCHVRTFSGYSFRLHPYTKASTGGSISVKLRGG